MDDDKYRKFSALSEAPDDGLPMGGSTLPDVSVMSWNDIFSSSFSILLLRTFAACLVLIVITSLSTSSENYRVSDYSRRINARNGVSAEKDSSNKNMDDVKQYRVVDSYTDNPFKMLIPAECVVEQTCLDFHAPIFSALRSRMAKMRGRESNAIQIMKKIIKMTSEPRPGDRGDVVMAAPAKGISAFDGFFALYAASLKHKVVAFLPERTIPIVISTIGLNNGWRKRFARLGTWTNTVDPVSNPDLYAHTVKLLRVDTCTYPSPSIRDMNFFKELFIQLFLHNNLENVLVNVCHDEKSVANFRDSSANGDDSDDSDVRAVPLQGLISLIRHIVDAGFIAYSPQRKEILTGHEIMGSFLHFPDKPIKGVAALPELFLFSRKTPLELLRLLQVNALDISLPEPILGKKDLVATIDNDDMVHAKIYSSVYESAEKLERVIEQALYYEELLSTSVVTTEDPKGAGEKGAPLNELEETLEVLLQPHYLTFTIHLSDTILQPAGFDNDYSLLFLPSTLQEYLQKTLKAGKKGGGNNGNKNKKKNA
jgi:hypothetical protein